MDRPFTIKQLLEDNICPVGKSQLINLIRRGEQQKKGILPEGWNYIIASNIGSGTRRPRWGVTKSEIDAWLERAKSSNQA